MVGVDNTDGWMEGRKEKREGRIYASIIFFFLPLSSYTIIYYPILSHYSTYFLQLRNPRFSPNGRGDVRGAAIRYLPTYVPTSLAKTTSF